MKNTDIKKGSIVKYNKGFYRVSFVTKQKVNLKSIFGNHLYFKGLPKTEVVEAESEWWEVFSNSETYKSM